MKKRFVEFTYWQLCNMNGIDYTNQIIINLWHGNIIAYLEQYNKRYNENINLISGDIL